MGTKINLIGGKYDRTEGKHIVTVAFSISASSELFPKCGSSGYGMCCGCGNRVSLSAF